MRSASQRVKWISSFHPKAYEWYGKRFVNSASLCLPALTVYIENPAVFENNDGFPFLRRLKENYLVAFYNRHVSLIKDIYEVHKGTEREKETLAFCNSFRSQAHRFFPKILALVQESNYIRRNRLDYDWLVWVDADVEFIRTIDDEFYSLVLDDNCDLVVLERKPTDKLASVYAENGFIAFNLRARGVKFLNTMFNAFVSGDLYTLDEFTDTAVLSKTLRAGGYFYRNLVPADFDPWEWSDKHNNHVLKNVWEYTILNNYMKHYKGPRKGDYVGA